MPDFRTADIGDVRLRCAIEDEGPLVILIGHDWGAPIVWNTALTRPERLSAVAGLSAPDTAGCGHCTQQERPAEVNRLLVEWLKSL